MEYPIHDHTSRLQFPEKSGFFHVFLLNIVKNDVNTSTSVRIYTSLVLVSTTSLILVHKTSLSDRFKAILFFRVDLPPTRIRLKRSEESNACSYIVTFSWPLASERGT